MNLPSTAPENIRVDRAARQRADVSDVTDLELSISAHGQIQPIVVTRDMTLVAGERRLRACQNLNLPVKYVFADTLDPIELECIELEENLKRRDLSWREITIAIATIHRRRLESAGPSWTAAKTADSLGYSPNHVNNILQVARNLDSPAIAAAATLNQAQAILARQAERRTAEIVNDIIHNATNLFQDESDDISPPSVPYHSIDRNADIPNYPSLSSVPNFMPHNLHFAKDRDSESIARQPDQSPHPAPSMAPGPVLNQDFIAWSAEYTGPKFSVIHCDFPYGTLLPLEKRKSEYTADESTYQSLLDAFCDNFNNFASYSCHLVFWFSMNFYVETRQRLESLGLWLYSHPLIWLDTSQSRIVPLPGKTPARVYHTAFFCSRGERPLVKTVNDAYPAPATDKPIHPTQKPIPMLRHFLSGVIDETTSVLDPTAGSGGALIAAEDLGAKHILGLELNAEYCAAANSAIHRQRLLRQMSKGTQV